MQAINAVAAATPSVDRCRAHKILGHVCYLYSAAEDRTLRVWDLYEGRLVATVRELPGGARPPTSQRSSPRVSSVPFSLSLVQVAPAGLREATFRCLGQSDRHLFAGTTGASVMVFSKQNECDRTDIHLCHMPNADKTYCLQSTLKLPKVRNGHGVHRTTCP